VSLSIRRGDDTIFKKVYRGLKSRKAEPFDSASPMQAGYLVKVNAAEVDYVEIAQGLLDHSSREELSAASRSENKYIRAAAALLSDPWRQSATPRSAR
jgi:multidrug efflux pump subunit AcrA (membrane-fusion protein)